MDILKNFIKDAKARFSIASYNTIREALKICIAHGKDKTRYNNDPMFYHPISVAHITFKEIGLGAVSTVCALLHDAVRTGYIPLSKVREQFGPKYEEVLRGMNNISAVETKTEAYQIEHFQELIVSYSTNPRIILVKLADRLEVARSLHFFPQEKQTKKAWETLHLYSQIAHKLGLYSVKSEMEDLSLKILEPEMYDLINKKLQESKSKRLNFIESFSKPIKERLEKENFKFTIKGRTKSIYSIWRKMKKQHISFEEIYDVFAIRIVIDCPIEQEKAKCWLAFSVVTDFYRPNTERMRDWISIPKSNGYESLHTTVITGHGEWVEVQIRTARMDSIAEKGIAAHWRYKGGVEGSKGAEWLQRVRSMMENVDIISNDSVEFDEKGKEVFVFTPNGDLRKFQKGATILDFAFEIHSNLGYSCIGGKINHKNVSIKEVLKNGDLVEVITSKNQKPKQQWLSFVVTSKAKGRIKVFLREEEAKMANLGREELERKLKNWKLPLTIDEATTTLVKYYKLKNGSELYERIVNQKITTSEIKDVITRYLSGENILKITEERIYKEKKTKENPNDYIIIDQEHKGINYKLAKCCNPIYGDAVFSFVTVMNGITIHRDDCANAATLKERFPYRILKAKWSDDAINGAFIGKLLIISDDVIGLENSIRDLLKELKVNLRAISTEYISDSTRTSITIEVPSIGYIDTILYKLQGIRGVRKAIRI